MCWVYTGNARIKQGNRHLVTELDLCKLPKEVLNKAKKQGVIKFKKNGKNKKGTETSGGSEKSNAKGGDCGCKGSNKANMEPGSV